MNAFRELASRADECLADRFSSGEPILGVLDDYSKHGPHDWQKIVLHYLLLENHMYRPNLHSEVLAEISTIETDDQISKLLKTQEEESAVYILSEEHKWPDLVRFKAALVKAIEGGLS